jgi:hypothetical protein
MPRRSYIVPVVILFLGVLAAKLLLTRVQCLPVQSSWISYEGTRGWPWTYSRSVRTNSSEFGTPGAWISTDFTWAALVADVALLLIALTVTGLLLRRRYRRVGRLLRFSLGEMLILVTIAAIACAWVSLRYRQRQLERQTFASFSAGTFGTREEYRGPEWLRRIVPGGWLTVFYRSVEVSLNDDLTDKTTIASLVRVLTNAPYVHELDARATLASHFIEPAPFANIDEVCLCSDGTADDVEYALAQIARWPQVHKLTINVDANHSISAFDPTEPGNSATRTDADRAAFGEALRQRSIGSQPRRLRSRMPQTKLTDAAMRSLAEMPALKYLAIANFPDVTSEGISRLAKATSLVGVSIPDHPQFSDESLKLLASRVKDLYIVQPDGGSRRIQSP